MTNQDLVVVAGLARYARLFGDVPRYESFGRPVIETFLNPPYYHAKLGMFERGDQANFVERTGYNEIILPMLRRIHADFPDDRIPGIIDNVTRHLFDAVVTGDDNLTHVAWGAETDPNDKTKVIGWFKTPHSVSTYPLLLEEMRPFAEKWEDKRAIHIFEEFERTVAAYVLSDGSLPASVRDRELRPEGRIGL